MYIRTYDDFIGQVSSVRYDTRQIPPTLAPKVHCNLRLPENRNWIDLNNCLRYDEVACLYMSQLLLEGERILVFG